MRKGGLLDRFPAHLLTGGGSEYPTVIIDDSSLGRLHLQPMPEQGRQVIVVSPDRDSLKKTMEATSYDEIGNLHFIIADPAQLPFRDKSVLDIVKFSGGATRSKKSTIEIETCPLGCSEFRRVLASKGRLLEITAMRRRIGTQSRQKCTCWSEFRRYFVRPSVGSRYFVTSEWMPSTWPFKSLQVGKLQSVRIARDLLIGKLGIRPLFDGASIAIFSNAPVRDPIETWSGSSDADGDSHRTDTFPADAFGIYIKADYSVILLGATDPGPSSAPVIVKFPLEREDEGNWKHHIQSLDELNSEVPSSIRHLLPKVVNRGVISGQAYWIETQCEGSTASNYWWKPGWGKKTSESGLQFLIDLHHPTCKPGRMHRSLFDELVGPTVAFLEDRTRGIDPTFCLDDLVEAIWDVFADRRIPLVRTHGDFWPGNLLVSPLGELTGVPDWEQSIKHGWPLLDLLDLIAFSRKWYTSNRFGATVTRKLAPRRLASWERSMIDRYNSLMGIEDDLWPGFVALYWMTRGAWQLQNFDERWIKKNLVRPLPRILGTVRSGEKNFRIAALK